MGLELCLPGAALAPIKAGNAYYGKTSILAMPHAHRPRAITDLSSGATIGVYFVRKGG